MEDELLDRRDRDIVQQEQLSRWLEMADGTQLTFLGNKSSKDGSNLKAELGEQVWVDQARIHDPKMRGWTALHLAASKGDAELCLSLITERKIDVDVQDMVGKTALHTAASAGHAKVVQLLCQQGAFVVARTHSGNTASMLARNACAKALKAPLQYKCEQIEKCRQADGSFVAKTVTKASTRVLYIASLQSKVHTLYEEALQACTEIAATEAVQQLAGHPQKRTRSSPPLPPIWQQDLCLTFRRTLLSSPSANFMLLVTVLVCWEGAVIVPRILYCGPGRSSDGCFEVDSSAAVALAQRSFRLCVVLLCAAAYWCEHQHRRQRLPAWPVHAPSWAQHQQGKGAGRADKSNARRDGLALDLGQGYLLRVGRTRSASQNPPSHSHVPMCDTVLRLAAEPVPPPHAQMGAGGADATTSSSSAMAQQQKKCAGVLRQWEREQRKLCEAKRDLVAAHSKEQELRQVVKYLGVLEKRLVLHARSQQLHQLQQQQQQLHHHLLLDTAPDSQKHLLGPGGGWKAAEGPRTPAGVAAKAEKVETASQLVVTAQFEGSSKGSTAMRCAPSASVGAPKLGTVSETATPLRDSSHVWDKEAVEESLREATALMRQWREWAALQSAFAKASAKVEVLCTAANQKYQKIARFGTKGKASLESKRNQFEQVSRAFECATETLRSLQIKGIKAANEGRSAHVDENSSEKEGECEENAETATVEKPEEQNIKKLCDYLTGLMTVPVGKLVAPATSAVGSIVCSSSSNCVGKLASPHAMTATTHLTNTIVTSSPRPDSQTSATAEATAVGTKSPSTAAGASELNVASQPRQLLQQHHNLTSSPGGAPLHSNLHQLPALQRLRGVQSSHPNQSTHAPLLSSLSSPVGRLRSLASDVRSPTLAYSPSSMLSPVARAHGSPMAARMGMGAGMGAVASAGASTLSPALSPGFLSPQQRLLFECVLLVPEIQIGGVSDDTFVRAGVGAHSDIEWDMPRIEVKPTSKVASGLYWGSQHRAGKDPQKMLELAGFAVQTMGALGMAAAVTVGPLSQRQARQLHQRWRRRFVRGIGQGGGSNSNHNRSGACGASSASTSSTINTKTEALGKAAGADPAHAPSTPSTASSPSSSPPPLPPSLSDHAITSLIVQAAENGVTRSLLQHWLVFGFHSRTLASTLRKAPQTEASVAASARDKLMSASAPTADEMASAWNSKTVQSLFAGHGVEFAANNGFRVTVQNRDARSRDTLYRISVNLRTAHDRRRLLGSLQSTAGVSALGQALREGLPQPSTVDDGSGAAPLVSPNPSAAAGTPMPTQVSTSSLHHRHTKRSTKKSLEFN